MAFYQGLGFNKAGTILSYSHHGRFMSRHKPAGKQGLHPVSANEQYLLVFLFIAHHQQVFRPRRRVLNAPRGNNRVSVVPGPASKQGPSVPSPPFPPTLRISSRPPWIKSRGSRLPVGSGPGGQASAGTDGRARPCDSNLPAARRPHCGRVPGVCFGGADPRDNKKARVARVRPELPDSLSQQRAPRIPRSEARGRGLCRLRPGARPPQCRGSQGGGGADSAQWTR